MEEEQLQLSAIYKCSNGMCYNVTTTPDIHQKLKEDSEFAETFFTKNLNNFELVVDENDLQDDDSKSFFIWNIENTKLLLDEYKKRRHLFRDPKQKKKLLWEEIVGVFLENGYVVTYDTLDRKFRNLKMTHKTITNSNKKRGGENTSRWPFYKKLTEILEGENDDDDEELTHKLSKGPEEGKSSIWTGENVLLLLKEYNKRKESFCDPLKQKRVLWEEIVKVFEDAGYEISVSDLDTKFRNLKKTYRRIKYGNAQYNRRWAYYDIFDKIMKYCDELPHIKLMEIRTRELDLFGEIKADEDSFFWDHEKTLLLIKEYGERKMKFFDPIKKKKLLWEEIVEAFKLHGYEVTPDMLDRKYRNMKATFTKIRQAEERKDGITIRWPYYEHLKEIYGDDSTDTSCEMSDISVDNKIMLNDLTIFVPSLHGESNSVKEEEKESNFTWTYESVVLLLTEYNNRKALFKDPKILKKTLWEEIVQVFKMSGLTVTNDLLDRKMRNLKMSYKKAKSTHRRKEGKWQYYDLLDMIFGDEKAEVEAGEIGDVITDSGVKFDVDDPITYFVSDDIRPVLKVDTNSLVESEELQPGNRQDLSAKMLEVEKERVSSIKLLQKSLDEYNRLLKRQIEVAEKRNKLLEQYIEKTQW